jgi:hypothetical protein
MSIEVYAETSTQQRRPSTKLWLLLTQYNSMVPERAKVTATKRHKEAAREPIKEAGERRVEVVA